MTATKTQISLPIDQHLFEIKNFAIIAPTLDNDLVFIASIKNLKISKLYVQNKYLNGDKLLQVHGSVEFFENENDDPDNVIVHIINELSDYTFINCSEKFEIKFELDENILN